LGCGAIDALLGKIGFVQNPCKDLLWVSGGGGRERKKVFESIVGWGRVLLCGTRREDKGEQCCTSL
jgi:hypothetical protein